VYSCDSPARQRFHGQPVRPGGVNAEERGDRYLGCPLVSDSPHKAAPVRRLVELGRIPTLRVTTVTRIDRTGIVAIARNEGERLRACLESALRQAKRVVYVDSGSTDGSVALAEGLGVHVVELDGTIPFTAARARNAGFAALVALDPDLEWVQFVDGDCEIEPGWIERAGELLRSDPSVVVVCGRRAERAPRSSRYNLLCDMEWDTPIGETEECGGDALMRVKAVQDVGGYRDDLIAGEEPDLCRRLRSRGGRIQRIDAPMTRHDARMDSFRQWWLRSVRAGHAYAEGAALQGGIWSRTEVRSATVWGILLPASIFVAALADSVLIVTLLALLFPLQITRVALRRPKPNFSAQDNWLYALSCVGGKLPNAFGQLRYWVGWATGRRSALIEYKGSETSDVPTGSN